MLAANFYEVPDLKVRVLDAGTAIGDIYEYAFGSLIVFALYCPTDTEHEVGGLLLDLPYEGSTSLLKVCRSSGVILAISSALSKESRWLTAMALNFSIRRKYIIEWVDHIDADISSSDYRQSKGDEGGLVLDQIGGRREVVNVQLGSGNRSLELDWALLNGHRLDWPGIDHLRCLIDHWR